MRPRELTATAVNRIRGSARIFGMIALMALSAACGGNGGITADDMTGTWRGVDFDWVLQFNEDGTYRTGRTIEGLEDFPFEVGEWTLEGALFTMIRGDVSANCSAGDRGIFKLEPIDDSRIHFVTQEEDCKRDYYQFFDLERVP
jgi:hypothetical protein